MDWAIPFLIFFTPLAMGSVYPWAYGIMEAVIFFLAALWMGRIFIKVSPERELGVHDEKKNRAWIWPVFFMLLILIQVIPLPLSSLHLLSPATYAIYKPLGTRGFFPLSLDIFATWSELLRIISYVLLFFIIAYYPFGDRRRSLRRIYFAAMLAGVIVGLLGLIQNFAGAERLLWIWKPVMKGDKSFFGPFVNPNHFAVYMEMIIGLFLGYIGYRLVKQGTGSKQGLKSWLVELERAHSKSILLCFLLLILTISLFFCLSRGGILITLHAFLFFLFMVLLRHRHAKGPIVITILCGLIFVFYLSYLGIEPILKELQSLTKVVDDISSQSRTLAWEDTWRMIKSFPLFGVGLGGFGAVFPRFNSMQAGVAGLEWLHAHNDYLQLWAELGVGGIIMVCCGLILFFLGAVKWVRRRHGSHQSREARRYLELGCYTALFCFLAHSVIDYSFYVPANVFLFVVICGMVVRMQRGRLRGRHVSGESPHDTMQDEALGRVNAHAYDHTHFCIPVDANASNNANSTKDLLNGRPKKGFLAGGRFARGFVKVCLGFALCILVVLIIAAVRGGFGQGGYNSIGDEEFQKMTLREIPVAKVMPLWKSSPFRHYFEARWNENVSFAEGLDEEKKKQLLQKAMDELMAALRLQPSKSLFWERLGYVMSLLRREGHNDGAFSKKDTGEFEKKGNGSFDDSVGETSMNLQLTKGREDIQGKFFDENDAFAWALYFAPNNALLRYRIGSFLWRMGDDYGFRVLKEAIRLDPSLRRSVDKLLKGK